MQTDRKIAPLDESSLRQIWVGWGSGIVCLALAYLVGGLFIPYLLLFVGATMAFRGHVPGWFAKHIDAQIIAGTPYRRDESIKAWGVALLICLLLAGASSWIHRRLAPGNPELAKTIENGLRQLLHRRQELRVENVSANLYPGKPIWYTVKVGNTGKVPIKGPRHTLVGAITNGVLGDLGERPIFAELRDSTTSYVDNPLFEIQPGMAVFFSAGNAAHSPDGYAQSPNLSTEDFKAIEDGKRHLYIMILLQYGPELSQPFDDGINRAHSVMCSHFTKGLSADGPVIDGPYYCNGFNYVRP